MAAGGWVDEALLQLRLAVAWKQCARAVGEPVVTALRERVLAPFLKHEWIPGARELVPALAEKWSSDAFWRRAGAHLTHALHGARVDGPDGACARLKDALSAADRADLPPATSGTPEWPNWVSAADVWHQQAKALAAWRDLAAVMTEPAEAEERLRELAATCRAHAKRLKRRGRDAHTAGLLAGAAAAIHVPNAAPPVVAPLAAARNLLADQPTDWPPTVLRDAWRELETETAPVGIDAVALPPPQAERLRLLVGLVEAADAAAALRPGVWETVGKANRLLFRKSKPSPHLVRHVNEAGREWERVVDPLVGEPVVRRSGVGYTPAGGSVVWVRRPQVAVPPPPPPLPAALRAAADAATDDPEFAACCRKAALAVPAPDGWTDDDRVLWWRVVQRAVLRATTPTASEPRAATPAEQRAAAAAALLQELSVAGVAPVPMPDAGEARGPWLVAAGESGVRAGPRCAVHFPDGKTIGPAVWLAVGPDRGPLGRCLSECEPLLLGLRAGEPDWPGWEKHNTAVWRWAYAGDGRPIASEVVGAFEAAYHRGRAADSLATMYRQLAGRLYHCVTVDLGTPIDPPLDPNTLDPLADGALPAGAVKTWVKGGSKLGEVLAVSRFGAADRPAAVTLGVGPGGEWMLPWLSLPKAPDGPLRDWQRRLEILLDPGRGVPNDQTVKWHKEDAQKWLNNLAGAEWFAARPAGDPWVARLLAEGWCQSYPAVNPANGRLWLPPDVRPGPRVRWEFSDAVEPRHLIGEARPAPSGEWVCGTFSLGPQAGAGAALAAAADLLAAAPNAAVAKTVWEREVAAHLHQTTRSSVEVAKQVIEWLLKDGRAAVPAARRWLAAVGFTLLPEADADGGDDPAPEFDAVHGPGERRVEAYGWKENGQVVRAPRVRVSAGPPPRGYPALADAVAAVGNPDVAVQLAWWPAAAAAGGLLGAAAEMHMAAWELRGRAPESAAAAALTRAIEAVLRDQFEVVTWVPHSIGEARDGWVRANGPNKTGKVLRAIYPALIGPGQELILAGEVYVE